MGKEGFVGWMLCVVLQARELLAWMYKLRRDKSMRDGLVFLLWFLTFVAVAMLIYDVHTSWTANEALRDLLLDEEFEGAAFKKNFDEVMSLQEVYAWLRGPFLNGLWVTEDGATGEPLPPHLVGSPYGVYTVVGGARLRQVRVRSGTCENTDYPGLPWQCYGQFSFGETDDRSEIRRERWWRDEAVVFGSQNTELALVEEFATRCTPQKLFNSTSPPAWAKTLFGGAEGSKVKWWAGEEDVPVGSKEGNSSAVNATGSGNGPGEYGMGGWEDGFDEIQALFGWTPPDSFGSGAFPVFLPARNPEAAWCVLAFLERGRWLNVATRALVAEVSLYNQATRMNVAFRVFFYIYPTGLMVKAARLYAAPIDPYGTVSGKVRGGLEVLFLLLTIFHIQKEVRRAYRAPKFVTYLFTVGTFFDVAILVAAAAAIVLWGSYILSPTRRFFDATRPDFVDGFPDAEFCVQVLTYAGFLQLLFALRMFKFFSVNRRMQILGLTLGRAQSALWSFVLALLLITLAFALFGELVFGPYMRDFKSGGWALSTVLRWPLGDFDYDALGRAQPALAGPYFVLFIVIIFLVFLNLILAIISVSYAEVHDEVRMADQWKAGATSFESEVFQRIMHFFRRLKPSCACGSKDQQQDGGSRGSGGRRPGAAVASGRRLSLFVARSTEEAQVQRDEGQLETWAAEAKFLENLHACMAAAKVMRGFDLFEYMERVFHAADDDPALCISWKEIVDLTTVRGTGGLQGDQEDHPDLAASKLFDSYFAMKDAIIIGRFRKHVRAIDECRNFRIPSFPVAKINRSGKRLRRRLFLDSDKAELLNFSAGDVLTKRLPLTQLVQLEREPSKPDVVTLVFTSQGVPFEEERQFGRGGLETTFRLVFNSAGRAEKFLRLLQLSRESLERRLKEVSQDMGLQVATMSPMRKRRSSQSISNMVDEASKPDVTFRPPTPVDDSSDAESSLPSYDRSRSRASVAAVPPSIARALGTVKADPLNPSSPRSKPSAGSRRPTVSGRRKTRRFVVG